MKRFFSFFAVLILSSTFVFANVEMDMNFFASPVKDSVLGRGKDDTYVAKCTVPLGLELQWGFYFGQPRKVFDAGLGLSVGFSGIYDYDIYKGSSKVGNKALDNVALNNYITFGPAFRLKFGDMHSVSISPGVGMSWIIDKKVSEFGINLNLDIGYRLWLINSDGFHFGLGIGSDLSYCTMGGSSYSVYTDSEDIEHIAGFNAGSIDCKIYLGVVFNFGDKRPKSGN